MSGSFFPLRKQGSNIDPSQFPALPPANSSSRQKNKDGSGRTQNLLPPLPDIKKVKSYSDLPKGFQVYLDDRNAELVPLASQEVKIETKKIEFIELLIKKGILSKYTGNLLVENQFSLPRRGRSESLSIFFSPRHIIPLTYYGGQIVVFQFGNDMIDAKEIFSKLTKEAKEAHELVGEKLTRFRYNRYMSISLYREFLKGVVGLDLDYTKKDIANLSSSRIEFGTLLDLVRDQLDLNTIHMIEEVDLPDEWLREIL